MNKFALILLLLLAGACSHNVQNKGDASSTTNISSHNSRNSIDWQGNYKGFLPCTDCNGVETFITLNADETYKFRSRFVGKSTEYVEKTGKFTWSETGSIIILDGFLNEPNKYLVTENGLIHLDINGNQILGNMQEEYVFTKITDTEGNSFYKALVDTKWRFLEFNSKPIPKAGEKERNTEITFSSQSGNIEGFAGCNTLNAPFNITGGNKLYVGKISLTKMSCPRIDIEKTFLGVFEKIDNFEVVENILILRKGKSTPIAKFIKVN